MNGMIRFASADDSASLLKIYAQYIDTPVTFEYELPTEDGICGANPPDLGGIPVSGVGRKRSASRIRICAPA